MLAGGGGGVTADSASHERAECDIAQPDRAGANQRERQLDASARHHAGERSGERFPSSCICRGHGECHGWLV